MTKVCNFPISETKRCTQPIADNKPNCGRHKIDLSANQLGQNPTVYRKDGELHVWAGDPDGLYCLIHNESAHHILCQLAGQTPQCCLIENVEWRDEHGELHRDDGPAMIKTDGTQQWYQHGLLHRDDGPAVIYANGAQEWYQRDEWHRDDGPARIHSDGAQTWYWRNRLHREDGPAIIGADGTQRWYWRGRRHRSGGPAVIWANGTQEWYQHDQLNRDDGPAIVRPDGTQEWYWYGEEITEQEHASLREQSRGV